MAADESAQQRILETFLRREVKAGLRTREQLEALSVEMFARMSDGTTVVEVTVEGGATRAAVNCPPHVVLAACETILAETDPENPLGNTSQEHRYADFSGGRIET